MRLKLLASWLVATVLAGVAVSAIASCDLSKSPAINPSIQDTPPPIVPIPLAGSNIQLLHTLIGRGNLVQSLVFSANNELLASGDRAGTIEVWNLATGQVQRSLNHSADIQVLAISPDGKTLASGGGGAAKLWNLTTGKLQRTLKVGSPVQISADTQILATGWREGRVRVWNLRTGKVLGIVNGSSPLAIGADGQVLINGDSDDSIAAWNPLKRQLILPLERHSGPVALSRDGKILAYGGNEGIIKIWNLGSDRVERTFKGGVPLAISPNGQTLASSQDKTIQLWNLKTGELLISLEDSEPFTSVAFSADGKLFASSTGNKDIANSSAEGTIKVWQLSL